MDSAVVTGSGFDALETVTVFVNWDDVFQPLLGWANADEGGAFVLMADATEIDAIAQAAADFVAAPVINLKAEGSEGSLASVPVTIVENRPTAEAPEIDSSIMAGAMTDSGMVTGVATEDGAIIVLGSGFKEKERVTVTALGADGRVAGLLGANKVTDGGGAVMFEGTAKLAPGVYTLEAFGSRGSTATAPLWVTAKP